MTRRIGVLFGLLLVVGFGPVLFAQVSSGVVPVDAAPSANEWGGTLIWAFFSSTALEWIKRNPKWSVISSSTHFWVQRGIGVLLALAAALGVHYTYDPSAGVLTVTGLTTAGIWTMGVETTRQYVIQEMTYRTAIKGYGATT